MVLFMYSNKQPNYKRSNTAKEAGKLIKGAKLPIGLASMFIELADANL